MDEKRVILVQNHPFLTVHLESWANTDAVFAVPFQVEGLDPG